MTEMTKNFQKVLHCQSRNFVITWGIVGCAFGFIFWNSLIRVLQHF